MNAINHIFSYVIQETPPVTSVIYPCIINPIFSNEQKVYTEKEQWNMDFLRFL